jgi:electron transfer flavoprotein beta subunit
MLVSGLLKSNPYHSGLVIWSQFRDGWTMWLALSDPEYDPTLMKIAVCVKHVPSGRLRLDPSTRRLDRKGTGDLNNVDLNAIEEALRMKDENECEVVVVSMGPSEAIESLRTALGLGADRAILVSDPDAEGSDLLATSRVLAAVIEREAPDLTLFGQQATDGSGAMLWAAVAERLRLPVASQAAELSVADDVVRVVRQSEFGDDVIEARLPAVVGVSDALNEPRYASLRGMMGAKKKPLEMLGLAELDLTAAHVGDIGSATEVIALADPPGRVATTWVEDGDDAPQVIFDFLLANQLL